MLNLVASLVVLSASADPALSASADPAPPPRCRLVAGWDSDRDLVAYEVRRDDCAKPAPALTGNEPNRRRKSIFELRRISTGKLVDAADCEISFSLTGGEKACDLESLGQFRKTFAALRPGRRGSPVELVGDELALPGAGAPAVVKLPELGETVVAATHAGTHRFVVLASGLSQALLRLPDQSVATKRRQQELLTQASVFADIGRLDSGRPLVKAARDQGRLDIALLGAFCAHPDGARRIDNWRAAVRDLDAGERTTLETALAGKRCFGRIDLAAYDGAGAQMAVARLWLDAVGRKDMPRVRELSTFPLVLKGFPDYSKPAAVAGCGGHIDKPDGAPESTLDIPDPQAFERARPCLLDGPTSNFFQDMPPLRDGRWPANREYWFGGWVGTTLPTTLKSLPRDLRRYAPALKPLLAGATPVQAVLTDNAGMTNSFVVLLVPVGDGDWRVRAVFAAERFDE